MKLTRAIVNITILCAMISSICGAQDAKPGPEFEVASVKQAPPRVPFSVALGLIHSRNDDLRFERSSATMTSLISFAYGITADRTSGPGWMGEQFFAIEAKLPDGSTKEETPAMLQKLLAERFKLTVHRDQKVEPVYELVIDKQSVKFKPHSADESATGCGSRPGQCICRGSTVHEIAAFLSGGARSRMAAMEQTGELAEHRIDRLIVDQTGLTGLYDIDLEWVPPNGLPASIPGIGDSFPPRDPTTKANSVFGALEAVGLKLQSAKHAFDTLVVDHVERVPSENE